MRVTKHEEARPANHLTPRPRPPQDWATHLEQAATTGDRAAREPQRRRRRNVCSRSTRQGDEPDAWLKLDEHALLSAAQAERLDAFDAIAVPFAAAGVERAAVTSGSGGACSAAPTAADLCVTAEQSPSSALARARARALAR